MPPLPRPDWLTDDEAAAIARRVEELWGEQGRSRNPEGYTELLVLQYLPTLVAAMEGLGYGITPPSRETERTTVPATERPSAA